MCVCVWLKIMGDEMLEFEMLFIDIWANVFHAQSCSFVNCRSKSGNA